MKKLLLFIIIFCTGKFVFGQCGCTNCPEPLPDNTNRNFYVNVSDNDLDPIDYCQTMLLESINLHFDHEYIGDLAITITSPCGNSILLTGNIGFFGATDGSVWNIGFVDGTPSPDPGFSPVFDNSDPWGINGFFTGTYNPWSGTIASLNCPDNCGTWIINVLDNQSNDFGNFLDFSLDFGDPSETGQLTCDSEAPPPCVNCADLLGPFTICYDSSESDLVLLEICPPPGQFLDAATILSGTFEAGFDSLTVYSGPSGSGTSGSVVLPPTFGNLENTVLTPVDSNHCLIFVSNSDGSISCAEGFQDELNIIACTTCSTNSPMNDEQNIPTLSQWGLICLALLFLSYGSIIMINESVVFAGFSTISLSIQQKDIYKLPFNKKVFKQVLPLTAILIGLGFLTCYYIYNTIFTSDIIGVTLAAPIFAYLMHLLIWIEMEKNKN